MPHWKVIVIAVVVSLTIFVLDIVNFEARHRRKVVRSLQGPLKDLLVQIKNRSQSLFRRPLVVQYFERDETDLVGAGKIIKLWYIGEVGGRRKFFGLIPCDRWLFTIPFSAQETKIECFVLDPAIVNIVKEEMSRFAGGATRLVEIIPEFNSYLAQA